MLTSGLTAWDITCYFNGWDPPPWSLHQLVVGMIVLSGMVGVIGACHQRLVALFEDLVVLSGEMDRARRGGKPGKPAAPASNVRQLRALPPHQEQLRRRAE